MKTYGIILAGGGGTRFWPLSRQDLPKQFLNLTGADMLVNETIDRLSQFVPKENIFVVTSAAQTPLMIEATSSRIPEDHILSEPAARNTSACIGYAAMEILRKYGDGVMCILPSDHYIKEPENYTQVMKKAIQTAMDTRQLVTVGIKPTFASSGYGYIQFRNSNTSASNISKSAGKGAKATGKALAAGKTETKSATNLYDNCANTVTEPVYYEVTDFVEKPDIRTAKAYVKSGQFLWNSGMFIWQASVILEYFKKLLPDIYEKLEEIGNAMGTASEREVIDRVYPDIPKISIDYGIMERADRVLVLMGEFGWNDVGSWDALQALYEPDENGNIIYGEQVHIGTRNCIAYAKSKLIAALGVEDLIIVEADDAIMVCHKDKAQDVKKIVEELKAEGKQKYL